MIKELMNYGDVTEHASLKNLNTFKIGGTCRYLISPNSINDLVEILKILRENGIKFFVLGNGSNVVLNDIEFDLAVIKLDKLNGVELYPEMQIVYAEAGAMVPKVVYDTVNAGLTGLEFASGIPGTIGGSIYGNAGCYNSCIMDYVSSVTVLDENYDVKVLEHEDITYGYRTTLFKETKKYIILAVKFYLKRGDKESSLELLNDRKVKRFEAQPLEYPSAGSVFRNPDDDFAGRLIDFCGLKGLSVGGAEVSEKHANFVINKNNASSKDVHDLIIKVHDIVLERTNVDLKIEQEFIGWE